MVWTSYPVLEITGTIRAPGDKSCSHRALIMAGLATGVSEISGLLESGDTLHTARAMADLGAHNEKVEAGLWRVGGLGGAKLETAHVDLDFGNSGTGARLMMGVIAGYPRTARFTGDHSLCNRPMDRVLHPLSLMGANHEAMSRPGYMPLIVKGEADLQAIVYRSPHNSAQVKSCLLLAGLRAQGETIIHENRRTRDHSERMLRGFGVDVDYRCAGNGARLAIQGGQGLRASKIAIPGDPSSTAFLAAAAMMSDHGRVRVENVMSNETRNGFFYTAMSMGAQIAIDQTVETGIERVVDMAFDSVPLRGVPVPVDLVPCMIDEFPILAVLAAHACGETAVGGAGELRLKESDRIAAIIAMLRVNGVGVEASRDGFVIEGCNGAIPGGGLVETHGDHRIAMSALIMGTAARKAVSVDDVSMIATSYPGFMMDMRALGGDIRKGF